MLPFLLLALPGTAAAADSDAPARTKLDSISLLPDGSQLHRVLLPRYDERQRLVGELVADLMTLVNRETISADGVKVGFYHPDGGRRGRLDLRKAVFRQNTGILSATENVALTSDSLEARGTGLEYSFDEAEGFLHGPATTWIRPTQKTAMNHPSPAGRAALAGLTVLAQPLLALPPSPPDAAGKAALAADARPSTPPDAGRNDLHAALDASAEATRAARDFLEKADVSSTQAGAPVPAPDQPLDIQPTAEDTVVRADGGMYFDADGGVFVFLNNVRVEDPRFQLSGANELKVFLAREETSETPDTSKPKSDGLGISAKFGKVERIVATGAVRILQRGAEKGKAPVEASGAVFVFRPESGLIDISGGYPWVRQGTEFLRAMEPELHLRIRKEGSFVTEGRWEMGGRIDQNR